MQKGAMMVTTIPGMNAIEDLASLRQIELVFLNWCTPPAENPLLVRPSCQTIGWSNSELM